MKDEAHKQEPVQAWFTADEFVEMADRRIKEWAKQEQGEPVAWMHTMIDDVVVGHRPADLNVHPDRWMPLYKDPTPCQTCEALARTVMMDQTAHDIPPAAPVQEPVRWTDEEYREISDQVISTLVEYGAELRAADCQMQILREELAESRREVAQLKAQRQCLVRADERTRFTVPDAITDNSESPEYWAGWNDCRAEMLKGQP